MFAGERYGTLQVLQCMCCFGLILLALGGACWFCMVGGRLWWAAATPFHGAGSKNTSKTYLSSLTPKKIYRSENPKVKHCNYASHLPFLYLLRPHSSSPASRSIARLETILTSPSSIPTKRNPQSPGYPACLCVNSRELEQPASYLPCQVSSVAVFSSC